MTRVSGILRHVPAGSSHPDCVFPQLAGSHLSEVSATGASSVLAGCHSTGARGHKETASGGTTGAHLEGMLARHCWVGHTQGCVRWAVQYNGMCIILVYVH